MRYFSWTWFSGPDACMVGLFTDTCWTLILKVIYATPVHQNLEVGSVHLIWLYSWFGMWSCVTGSCMALNNSLCMNICTPHFPTIWSPPYRHMMATHWAGQQANDSPGLLFKKLWIAFLQLHYDHWISMQYSLSPVLWLVTHLSDHSNNQWSHIFVCSLI